MPQVLLTEAEIAARVEAVADQIAPVIDNETVIVCLLTGGVWFAADLTRALYRRGRDPLFDCLWLASYGDARQSSGRVEVRSGLQRDVYGRKVLLVDDVFDSGLSLQEAVRHVQAMEPAQVLTCVFARKAWALTPEIVPDFVAWEAPAEFLIGYGMDNAGRGRGGPVSAA